MRRTPPLSRICNASSIGNISHVSPRTQGMMPNGTRMRQAAVDPVFRERTG